MLLYSAVSAGKFEREAERGSYTDRASYIYGLAMRLYDMFNNWQP